MNFAHGSEVSKAYYKHRNKRILNLITILKEISLAIELVKKVYMLWFKFSFGAKLLNLVQLLFSFVMYSFP